MMMIAEHKRYHMSFDGLLSCPTVTFVDIYLYGKSCVFLFHDENKELWAEMRVSKLEFQRIHSRTLLIAEINEERIESNAAASSACHRDFYLSLKDFFKGSELKQSTRRVLEKDLLLSDFEKNLNFSRSEWLSITHLFAFKVLSNKSDDYTVDANVSPMGKILGRY